MCFSFILDSNKILLLVKVSKISNNHLHIKENPEKNLKPYQH
jgi:hypothetical protein